MTLQCSDNKADRAIGEYWERKFCEMAGRYGLMFTPIQWQRQQSAIAYKYVNHKLHVLTLPDVTIWTAPGQHHEIKHKAPTRHGSYGLEEYRFRALLDFAAETQQDVYYTIHDHSKAGGRDARTNAPEHWVTCRVSDLVGRHSTFYGTSYVNGAARRVPICYWNVALWQPLIALWQPTFDMRIPTSVSHYDELSLPDEF